MIGRKDFDDGFSRFDIIHKCHRQTLQQLLHSAQLRTRTRDKKITEISKMTTSAKTSS